MAKKESSADLTGETTDTTSADAPQPQLVKHGPMMADPAATATEVPATAPIVNRGGKKIAPVTVAEKDATAETNPFDTIPTDEEKVATSGQAADAATDDEAPEADTPKPAKGTAKTDDTEVDDGAAEVTDAESDTEQAEPDVSGTVESETSSADTVRRAELDKLIAAGTYTAPISMRKSSRAIVGSLSILAFVLLLVLGDVWLDMGLMNVSGVPHTHFFSAKSSPAVSTPTPAPAVKPAKESARTTLTKSSIVAIVAGINQYWANNKGTYPAELTVGNLSSVDPTVLSPPSGVTYNYKALPAGCTTAAHNCTSYTFTATDTATHHIIASEHS